MGGEARLKGRTTNSHARDSRAPLRGPWQPAGAGRRGNAHRSRPPLRPFGASNVACAGDWVRMGDREHGAKGLCQERALVSGYEAANSLLRDGALRRDGAARRPHPVLPVRPDEPQVELGRSMLRSTADAARFLGLPPSPWVR